MTIEPSERWSHFGLAFRFHLCFLRGSKFSRHSEVGKERQLIVLIPKINKASKEHCRIEVYTKGNRQRLVWVVDDLEAFQIGSLVYLMRSHCQKP